MLKKLTLLMLVALVGVVASGTVAWGEGITGVFYNYTGPTDYKVHNNKPCAKIIPLVSVNGSKTYLNMGACT